MKLLWTLLVAVPGSWIAARGQVTLPKMDSTLKIGKVGYRVECKNKNIDQNPVDIRPIGFSNEAHQMGFLLGGRVAKAEIDDLNSDGYPDLVLYVYMDSSGIFKTVYAFISKANKSVTGCVLPDPAMDGKINEGYRGHNEFSLMQGYVLEKFPIYKPGDEKDKPTGGTRAILYQLVPGENESFKFEKVRNYDTH